MFKEMLEEFEQMKAAGEDMELFSSEVLNTIEKEAILGYIARGARALAKSVGTSAGRPITHAAGGVGKSLFNAQMTVTKSMVKDPVGAAFLAAPVLAGHQSITQGLAENVIPLYDRTKNVIKDLRQAKQRSQVPQIAFSGTKNTPYKHALNIDHSISKEALFNFDFNTSDPIKEVINSVGVAAAAGTGAYVAHDYYTKAKETSNWAKGLSQGIDAAVTGVGKSTAKAITKNKPLSRTLLKTLGTAGKIADKLTPNDNSLRLDFSTLKRKRSPLTSNLPLFLATTGGATLLEEWLADKALGGIEHSIDKYRGNEQRTNKRNDRRPHNTYRQADTLFEGVEKEALNRDTKRLISEQMIKPAVTTGVSLTTLALLSRLVGHNLYGGMEKIRKDDDIGTKRVIIDVPNDEISADARTKKKIEKALSKQADIVQDMRFLNEDKEDKATSSSTTEEEPKTKMDKIKDKLDEKIQKNKVLSKIDDVMTEEKYRYTGKRGLAHFLVEEAPYKTVGALGYAAPMVAAGVILDRNLKRGFEPLQDEPGIPSVPEGTTRVVIMERPGGKDKGEEKKASTLTETAKKAGNWIKDKYTDLHHDPLTRFLTAVNFVTIPPTLVSIKEMLPKKEEAQEKKASADKVIYFDPNKKINKQPFLENAVVPNKNSEAAKYRAWERQELLKLLKKVREVKK